MRLDNRFSRVLHVLIHMADSPVPLTSESIAEMLKTNPVVVRRMLGSLRDRKYVGSAKGHGGGWILLRDLRDITLADIYEAIGKPRVIALGLSDDAPDCLIEKSVNRILARSLRRAEAMVLAELRDCNLAQIAKSLTRRRHARL